MIIGIPEFFESGGIALMGKPLHGEISFECCDRLVDDPFCFFMEIRKGRAGIYSLNGEYYYPIMIINQFEHKLVFATWDELDNMMSEG